MAEDLSCRGIYKQGDDTWRADSLGFDDVLTMAKFGIKEDELPDPESLENVEPEEKFEGYTGN